MQFTHEHKIIGEYNPDQKIFRKRVKHATHYFRKYNAYGIQKAAVDRLAELGCKEVRIKEEDTGKIYFAPFDLWQTSTLIENHSYGDQVFVPLASMTKKQ
jgi:hypothetical protein